MLLCHAVVLVKCPRVTSKNYSVHVNYILINRKREPCCNLFLARSDACVYDALYKSLQACISDHCSWSYYKKNRQDNHLLVQWYFGVCFTFCMNTIWFEWMYRNLDFTLRHTLYYLWFECLRHVAYRSYIELRFPWIMKDYYRPKPRFSDNYYLVSFTF